jgi:hypothetical protein
MITYGMALKHSMYHSYQGKLKNMDSPELSRFGTHVASQTIAVIIIDTVLAIYAVMRQLGRCLPLPQFSMLCRNRCGMWTCRNRKW